MQRVSAFLPSWEKRGSSSRGSGFFGWSNRSSTPNALSKLNVAVANGRVQRESLWPATLDIECDKAARIVKSFCADGYLPPMEDESLVSPASDDKSPIKLTRKIPKRVLQNAAGIAIFTCMRSGLWMTGSGGSGILIARKSDGTWSPPSGIMLHTPTLSFIIGVDVYDCVLVISNLAALESITRSSVTLGEDVGLISGPSVTLDSDEKEVQWSDIGNSVLSYVKSRGHLQMVNLNGCILTERANENSRFYSGDVTQMDILAGNVARHVEETKPLFEVIKLAEGRTDFEPAVIDRLALTPAPGDAMIATPSSTPATPRTAFGRLNIHDPDPFGVLALEMAGLEIREAGSRLRPSSSQFDLNAGPLSPAHSKFSRQSMDTYGTRSNRGSHMSTRTVKSQATDVGTQTDVGNTPDTTPSPGQSEAGHERSSFDRIPEDKEEQEEVDYTKIDFTPLQHLSQTQLVTENDEAVSKSQNGTSAPARSETEEPKKDVDASNEQTKLDADDRINDADDGDDEEDDEEDDAVSDLDDDEEPVVFEVASVQTASTQAVRSRVIQAKGNVVTIPKRIPPPLPSRSPARMSRSSKSELGPEFVGFRSPLHQSFTEADVNARNEGHYSDEPAEADVEIARFVGGEENELGDGERSSSRQAQSTAPVRVEVKQDKHELQGAHDSSDVGSNEDMLCDFKGDTASLSAGSARSFENTDNSDSTPGTKHTSFIYMGSAGDRWSCDGSALTTPTSYSVTDDMVGEETPKREEQVSGRSSLNEEGRLRDEAVMKTTATINTSIAV